MNTVQTNVRVPPDDKPVMRAIALRLRTDPRFADRLKQLLAEEASPALEERIARLEEQMQRLLASPGCSGRSFADPAEGGEPSTASRVGAIGD
ncbi:MAG TPA: hypothetical protein VMU87_04895 [Stellaceae bacterium]|nr:hypothetical protein [Stellaceae bacterium]